MIFRNRTLRCILLVALSLLLALPGQAQANTARIRAGHFALDVGPLDIYVDGAPFLENVRLATMTEWQTLAPGTHTVVLTLADTSVEAPLVTPTQVTLNADEWVTLAVIGRRAQGTLRLQRLLENFGPLRPGETRLSFFHAFYPNPPLTIAANGTPVIVNLAYPGTAGANDGMETVTLVVRSNYSLTISLTDGTPVKTITVGMGSNRHYFIGLTGTMDNPITVVVSTDLTSAGTPALAATPAASATPPAEATVTDTATPVQATSGQALLRMGHFAPGAPDFTIYLNETRVVALLPYPTLSEYVVVDAGTYSLAIALQGESAAAAILRQSITLAADSVVTIMVFGSLDTGTFKIQMVEEDYSPLRPALARVAIFHAVPDAAFINLVANDTLLVERLAFPGAFAGGGDGFFSVDVVARNYQLFVELNDQTTLNLGTIRMGVGRYYFFVIAGITENAFFVMKANTVSDIKP